MTIRIFILATLWVLAGCTSLSQSECGQANWQQLGYQHGEKGYTYARGAEIVLACKEFGITPKMEDYQQHYQKGLKQYCNPENGFAEGLNGTSYNSVCNSTEFRKAWVAGNERYQIQKRMDEIDSRIDEITARIANIYNELSSKNITYNQQQELTDERKDLKDELKALKRERTLLPVLNKLPSLHFNYQW